MPNNNEITLFTAIDTLDMNALLDYRDNISILTDEDYFNKSFLTEYLLTLEGKVPESERVEAIIKADFMGVEELEQYNDVLKAKGWSSELTVLMLDKAEASIKAEIVANTDMEPMMF